MEKKVMVFALILMAMVGIALAQDDTTPPEADGETQGDDTIGTLDDYDYDYADPPTSNDIGNVDDANSDPPTSNDNGNGGSNDKSNGNNKGGDDHNDTPASDDDHDFAVPGPTGDAELDDAFNTNHSSASSKIGESLSPSSSSSLQASVVVGVVAVAAGCFFY